MPASGLGLPGCVGSPAVRESTAVLLLAATAPGDATLAGAEIPSDLGAKTPAAQCAFRAAKAMPFPVEPETTRPLTSTLPEPARLPFGWSAKVNGAAPFFTLTRI